MFRFSLDGRELHDGEAYKSSAGRQCQETVKSSQLKQTQPSRPDDDDGVSQLWANSQFLNV